jgi:hypothetical protein
LKKILREKRKNRKRFKFKLRLILCKIFALDFVFVFAFVPRKILKREKIEDRNQKNRKSKEKFA